MMFYFGRKKAGNLVSVESKSIKLLSNGFTKIAKLDYDNFIASLPKSTPRNLKAEYAAAPDKIKFMAKQMGLI